ncbi:hypothetical protein VRC34_12005 [Pseudomonas poae]
MVLNLSTKVAVHAIVGGLIGEAAGGDFRTAALAAGANKALISLVGDKIFPGDQHERLLAMTSQLLGMTVAAAAGGDAKAQEKAAWVAQQATVYNNLKHVEAEALLKEIKDCRATNTCGEDELKGILGKYEKLSAKKLSPYRVMQGPWLRRRHRQWLHSHGRSYCPGTAEITAANYIRCSWLASR